MMNETSANETPEITQPTVGDSATPESTPLPVHTVPKPGENAAASQTAAATPSTDAPTSPVKSIQNQALEASIIEALRTVYDPEIPVNIDDMGLIYNIAIDADNKVDIRMTLTSPMCPVAGSLPPEAANKVKTVEGVTDATVELVWDPPWTPDNMSEAAKLELNM